jgi:DNA-directed RNA polymerase specialized sigma24 family protein
MSPRVVVCQCAVCQLDRSLIARLEQPDAAEWYQALVERVFILSWFRELPSLIAHMHARVTDAKGYRDSDLIYLALIEELSAPEHNDLAQALLLRALMPALHKEFRTIRRSFPQFLAEDLAQQLIATCLEVVRSPGIRRKTSYLASSIVERTKRDTMRWCIRQYRTGSREETEKIIDEVFIEESSKTDFEPGVLLRALLDKAVRMGILSAAERSLVEAYELENLAGEELGRREGLSPKALSYKVRAALARLSRAFHGSGVGKVSRSGKSSRE